MPQDIADHDLIRIAIDISKPKKLSVIRTFCHLLEKRKIIIIILQIDHVNAQVNIFNVDLINSLNDCSFCD